MRPSRLVPLAALLLAAAPVLAQEAARPSTGLNGAAILSTIVYGVIGIALCVLGYFAFDKVAGLSLKHELVEDQNVAVGIMLAGAFIGISIVVASVMLS